MAISQERMNERLRPFLQRRIEPDDIDTFMAEDLLDFQNEAMHDLNESAQLRIERYYKKTGTDNSEDAEKFNYKLQGIISKLFYFKFEDDDWRTQEYAITEDRIVLKNASSGSQMDILYLRRCEELDAGTDEVDLPDEILPEYLEVVKAKILYEHGMSTLQDYLTVVDRMGMKADQKVDRPKAVAGNILRNWFDQKGDDHTYVITDQKISIDNFVVDGLGNYSHVDVT